MTQLGLPETFSRETKGVPHWNRCSKRNRAVLSARKQSEIADLGNDSRMQFYRLQIWITNGRGPQIALIPCRNLQGKFLRQNTKGHCSQIDHRSIHQYFDVVKTLKEGNSPRPEPTRPLQAIY